MRKKMETVVFCKSKDTALVKHKHHLWQYTGTLGPYPTEPNLLIHALKYPFCETF